MGGVAVIHLMMAAAWAESSAAHFVGTFVGLALIALLAMVGAACTTRQAWRFVRRDVTTALRWAAGVRARRRWNRSASAAATSSLVLVTLINCRPLPKRVPHHVESAAIPEPTESAEDDGLFAGPSAHDVDLLIEEVITIANRITRGEAPGGTR